MGNMCGKSETQMEQLPLSVGKNYKELGNLYSGEGIKRTCSWEAEITRQELVIERERFWGTRSTGNRRIWLQLKQAIEADHLSAAMLLQMVGISVQKGSMTSCIDVDGNVYEIPVYILNDPMHFAEDQQVQPKKQGKPQSVKDIELKVRSMTTQKDRHVTLPNTSTVAVLKSTLSSQEDDLSLDKCRLFFNGKVLKDEETLMDCGVKQGMVVQLLEAKKSD